MFIRRKGSCKQEPDERLSDLQNSLLLYNIGICIASKVKCFQPFPRSFARLENKDPSVLTLTADFRDRTLSLISAASKLMYIVQLCFDEHQLACA